MQGYDLILVQPSMSCELYYFNPFVSDERIAARWIIKMKDGRSPFVQYVKGGSQLLNDNKST